MQFRLSGGGIGIGKITMLYSVGTYNIKIYIEKKYKKKKTADLRAKTNYPSEL